MPEGDAEGNATHRAAQAAYEAAGIAPSDVSVAEVHDPSAPQELFDIEEEPTAGGGTRTVYRINPRFELHIQRQDPGSDSTASL